jgi:hypothetical protein
VLLFSAIGSACAALILTYIQTKSAALMSWSACLGLIWKGIDIGSKTIETSILTKDGKTKAPQQVSSFKERLRYLIPLGLLSLVSCLIFTTFFISVIPKPDNTYIITRDSLSGSTSNSNNLKSTPKPSEPFSVDAHKMMFGPKPRPTPVP